MNGHFQLLAKEKVKKVGFSNKSCAETELPTEVSNGGVEHQPGWQCSPGTSQGERRPCLQTSVSLKETKGSKL